jgi:hypothetical protein
MSRKTILREKILKNNCISIYYKMTSCYQIAGSLTASKLALSPVGQSLIDTVYMREIDTQRTKSTDSGVYTYYILTKQDLNSLITYFPSDTGSALDDAYSFAGLTVSNDASANFYLPAVSGVQVAAGLITADVSQNLALSQEFPVTLTINVDAAGVMTASILLSGANFTSYVVDSNMLAQVAYWDLPSVVSVPSAPAADAADILTATVSAGQLSTYFSSQLAAVLAYYNNQEMITSWTIALAPIAKATDNTLSLHARNIGNEGNSTVFAPGAKVMAHDAFSYGISIVDCNGASQVIVGAQNVFGLVEQL